MLGGAPESSVKTEGETDTKDGTPIYISPDYGLYDYKYEPVGAEALRKYIAGMQGTQGGGRVPQVAGDLRGMIPPLPRPDQYGSYSEYVDAFRGWRDRVNAAMSHLAFPNSLGRKFYRPGSGPYESTLITLLQKSAASEIDGLAADSSPLFGSVDGEHKYSGKLEMLQKAFQNGEIGIEMIQGKEHIVNGHSTWDSQLIPKEPSPYGFDNVAEYEEALLKWSKLVKQQLKVIPPHPKEFVEIFDLISAQQKRLNEEERIREAQAKIAAKKLQNRKEKKFTRGYSQHNVWYKRCVYALSLESVPWSSGKSTVFSEVVGATGRERESLRSGMPADRFMGEEALQFQMRDTLEQGRHHSLLSNFTEPDKEDPPWLEEAKEKFRILREAEKTYESLGKEKHKKPREELRQYIDNFRRDFSGYLYVNQWDFQSAGVLKTISRYVSFLSKLTEKQRIISDKYTHTIYGRVPCRVNKPTDIFFSSRSLLQRQKSKHKVSKDNTPLYASGLGNYRKGLNKKCPIKTIDSYDVVAEVPPYFQKTPIDMRRVRFPPENAFNYPVTDRPSLYAKRIIMELQYIDHEHIIQKETSIYRHPEMAAKNPEKYSREANKTKIRRILCEFKRKGFDAIRDVILCNGIYYDQFVLIMEDTACGSTEESIIKRLVSFIDRKILIMLLDFFSKVHSVNVRYKISAVISSFLEESKSFDILRKIVYDKQIRELQILAKAINLSRNVPVSIFPYEIRSRMLLSQAKSTALHQSILESVFTHYYLSIILESLLEDRNNFSHVALKNSLPEVIKNIEASYSILANEDPQFITETIFEFVKNRDFLFSSFYFFVLKRLLQSRSKPIRVTLWEKGNNIYEKVRELMKSPYYHVRNFGRIIQREILYGNPDWYFFFNRMLSGSRYDVNALIRSGLGLSRGKSYSKREIDFVIDAVCDFMEYTAVEEHWSLAKRTKMAGSYRNSLISESEHFFERPRRKVGVDKNDETEPSLILAWLAKNGRNRRWFLETGFILKGGDDSLFKTPLLMRLREFYLINESWRSRVLKGNRLLSSDFFIELLNGIEVAVNRGGSSYGLKNSGRVLLKLSYILSLLGMVQVKSKKASIGGAGTVQKLVITPQLLRRILVLASKIGGELESLGGDLIGTVRVFIRYHPEFLEMDNKSMEEHYLAILNIMKTTSSEVMAERVWGLFCDSIVISKNAFGWLRKGKFLKAALDLLDSIKDSTTILYALKMVHKIFSLADRHRNRMTVGFSRIPDIYAISTVPPLKGVAEIERLPKCPLRDERKGLSKKIAKDVKDFVDFFDSSTTFVKLNMVYNRYAYEVHGTRKTRTPSKEFDGRIFAELAKIFRDIIYNPLCTKIYKANSTKEGYSNTIMWMEEVLGGMENLGKHKGKTRRLKLGWWEVGDPEPRILTKAPFKKKRSFLRH